MITKLLAILLLGVAGLAQQTNSVQSLASGEQKAAVRPRPSLAADTDFRRFVFTLSELDHGRKLNSRGFELLAREGDEPSSLRTGTRVPIIGGTTSEKDKAQTGVNYIDVGLNAMVRYNLRADGKLNLTTQVEMGTLAASAANLGQLTTDVPKSAPAIRQTRAQIATVITPDVSTVLFTIEELTSGHTFELSVVARSK